MPQALVRPLGIDALRARTGEVIGASPWLAVEQSRIDAFAETTLDHQFIHVDPARAQATPLGSTIAHGFLTLSLLSHFAEAVLPEISGLAMSMNYGFDRVRFVAPVRAGTRVRGVFSLAALEQQADHRFQMRLAVTIEIEGEAKPALVADWLTVLFMVQD